MKRKLDPLIYNEQGKVHYWKRYDFEGRPTPEYEAERKKQGKQSMEGFLIISLTPPRRIGSHERSMSEPTTKADIMYRQANGIILRK